MTSRNEKQQKFSAPKKNNTFLYAAIGFFVVVGITASVYFTQGGNSPKAEAAAYNTGSAVTYSQPVEMTDIKNTVEGDKIALNIADVKKAGIVYTEYNQNGKKVALTAWVAGNGDVTAAVSMCEPCRGNKFHIEGNEIVCNVCGTRWTLDTLQGVSGGCLKYPPDKVKYQVNDGKILLDKAQVDAWQPRV